LRFTFTDELRDNEAPLQIAEIDMLGRRKLGEASQPPAFLVISEFSLVLNSKKFQ
jgi:hypothetical protein